MRVMVKHRKWYGEAGRKGAGRPPAAPLDLRKGCRGHKSYKRGVQTDLGRQRQLAALVE